MASHLTSKDEKKDLEKIPHVSRVQQVKEGWLLETKDLVDLRKVISQQAVAQGWLVLTLRTEELTLEEVFKKLTQS